MDKRIERLNEIRNEVFDLANSFAGDKTGTVAGNLHGVSNRLGDCIRMLETGITKEDEVKLMAEWLRNNPMLMQLMATPRNDD